MSEAIWDTVVAAVAERTSRVFALPGDDMVALGALTRAGLQTTLVRSQRAAVLMALGHAAVTGEVAVVVVGRGPGAAACVPALLEVSTGRSGLLLLTGGCPLGLDRPQTFQHSDQRALLAPVSTTFRRVESVEDAHHAITAALITAGPCREGIACLEIPDPVPHPEPDVLPTTSRTSLPSTPRLEPTPWVAPPPPSEVQEAQAPVILVGAGARGIPTGEVEQLAHRWGAAMLCTASGRGIVDESHPLFLGAAGLYLHPAAQALLERSDLLLSLGSRLEETAVTNLPPQLPVVQVNRDPADFSPAHPGLLLPGDVRTLPRTWCPDLEERTHWAAEVHGVRAAQDAWGSQVRSTSATVSLLATAVASLPPGGVLCQENGLMDIWGYLFPAVTVPRGVRVLVPSEQTTLGLGCLAALGARLAPGHAPVLAVTGDGAFAVAEDEIRHAGAAQRPTLFLVLDNGGFGWLEAQDRAVNGSTGRFLTPAPDDAARPSAGQVLAALAGPGGADVEVLRVCCSLDEGPPVVSGEW